MPERTCAYCGSRFARRAGTRDHVVPACLYPASSASSKVSRITVPACFKCNNGWSSDEPHFRALMQMASTANRPATELWRAKTLPSFAKADGLSRLQSVYERMKPIEMNGQQRFMVYPAQDPRVLRIARKAVRGLLHHHKLLTAVPEVDVWVDVLRFRFPPAFEEEFVTPPATDPQVFSYRYWLSRESDLHSAWTLRFFESCTFLAVVGPDIGTPWAA